VNKSKNEKQKAVEKKDYCDKILTSDVE